MQAGQTPQTPDTNSAAPAMMSTTMMGQAAQASFQMEQVKRVNDANIKAVLLKAYSEGLAFAALASILVAGAYKLLSL